MPITERTLKRWRKDALVGHHRYDDPNFLLSNKECDQLFERILRLTQELLDQHLMTECKSSQTKRGE